MSLLKAVKDGNFNYVKEKIDSSIWYKCTEWADYILLNTALQCNRREIAQFLIQKGCRVNKGCTSRPENTPLHNAVILKNEDLMEALLEKGASLKLKNMKGDTPLHLAAKTIKRTAVIAILIPFLETVSDLNIVDEYRLSHFHIACMSGCLADVKTFLKSQIDINHSVNVDSLYYPGFTPLHFAMKSRKMEIAELLLSMGANANATDAKGITPLHLAFRKKYKNLIKVIFLSTDATAVNHVDDKGISYLHIACSENDASIVEKLLQHGIEINSAVNDNYSSLSGYTPLHIAVINGCDKVVEVLLKYNASFTLKDTAGFTPLHLAYWKKQDAIIDLILAVHYRNYENPADCRAVTHFHIACMKDFPHIVKGFVKNGVKINNAIISKSESLPGFTPLHIAVKCVKVENALCLLKNKADVNAKEIDELTPLHLACCLIKEKLDIYKRKFNNLCSELRESMIWPVSKNEPIALLQLLLKYNSDINAKDKHGRTPLFYMYGLTYDFTLSPWYRYSQHHIRLTIRSYDFKVDANTEITLMRKQFTILLLQHNIDLNISDDKGFTILHFVVNAKGEDKIVELLIKSGADVNAKNYCNETPLHLAIRHNCQKIIDLLLQNNADVNIAETNTLSTPLHLCAFHSISIYINDTFSKLIQRGANVNAKMQDGKTVLHILLITNRFRFIDNKLSNLCATQCSINIQDSMGKTALHYACINQNGEDTKWLLDHGANIDIKDNDGNIALKYIQTRSNVPNVVLSHVTKLKVIGYCFSKENKLIADHLQQQNKLLINEERCINELNRLKNLKVNSYTSLYNILFKSSNEMTIHVKNDMFKQCLECDLFKKEFPLYRPLLKLQFKRGLSRIPLLQPAKDSFKCLCKIILPEFCYENILGFLSDDNLKDLIAAQSVVISCENELKTETKKRTKLNSKKYKRLN